MIRSFWSYPHFVPKSPIFLSEHIFSLSNSILVMLLVKNWKEYFNREHVFFDVFFKILHSALVLMYTSMQIQIYCQKETSQIFSFYIIKTYSGLLSCDTMYYCRWLPAFLEECTTPWRWGNMFIWNLGNHLQYNMASQTTIHIFTTVKTFNLKYQKCFK